MKDLEACGEFGSVSAIDGAAAGQHSPDLAFPVRAEMTSRRVIVQSQALGPVSPSLTTLRYIPDCTDPLFSEVSGSAGLTASDFRSPRELSIAGSKYAFCEGVPVPARHRHAKTVAIQHLPLANRHFAVGAACFWRSQGRRMTLLATTKQVTDMKNVIALALVISAVALGACRREETVPVPMKLGGPVAEQPVQ